MPLVRVPWSLGPLVLWSLTLGIILFFAARAGASRERIPAPISGPTSIRLIERGAILAEDFDGPALDTTLWRVWQNNPTRSSVVQEGGRLQLTASGQTRMEGLWGLTTAKYKDVVLVARMDVRSRGTAPHRLALHLCGGDGIRSPDHWVEIQMVDLGGGRVRLSPRASLSLELDRRVGQYIEMQRPPEGGFACRLELNGETNEVVLSVRTPDGFRRICEPIELPLRTIHTEVKFNAQEASAGPGETHSEAWFDDVRIYPRHQTHHVGVRLAGPGGATFFIREPDPAGGAGWPPKFTDAAGRLRPITDIEVQLRTAGGERIVAATRSPTFGFYLLPLKDAPWDEFPVPAEIWLMLDGDLMGSPIGIECRGVDGMYPDDVYEITMQ